MKTNPTAISSPCVRKCCLDQDDICLGCFRSLTEITSWSQADGLRRQAILNNAKKRGEVYRQKYDYQI